MTLIRRLADTIMWQQQSLIRAQRMLIQLKNDELKEARETMLRALSEAQLEHALEMQGIVCAWLINLERPEFDLREDLAQLEERLGHDIAVLEEHVV